VKEVNEIKRGRLKVEGGEDSESRRGGRVKQRRAKEPL